MDVINIRALNTDVRMRDAISRDPQMQITHRITIKLQLPGKSRLI